ncbi:STM3941 family protein [Dokdonella sp.]|uniref:STM3941 family protein n=1 Tax=Dokdonella sp. TaxID=2291710 RepID=UPI003C373963
MLQLSCAGARGENTPDNPANRLTAGSIDAVRWLDRDRGEPPIANLFDNLQTVENPGQKHSMTKAVKTLRPQTSTTSKLKAGLLLLVSLMFVACGIWMFADKALTGLFIIAFFGLCALVFVIQLIPGSSWLRLDDEGFTYCALFRKRHVRWCDVEALTVTHIGAIQRIGWNYAVGCKDNALGRDLNRALAGVDAALPDNYGKSASVLAELMGSYLCESR